MRIKSIVVDDEPLSQDVIDTYLAGLPEFELVKKCSTAIEAIETLRQHTIDLIFLDVNMPVLSGINMLKSLASPPLVIFTTAYPEHALDGFELNAVDYLVKPFSFERFMKAINKVRQIKDSAGQPDQFLTAAPSFVAIRSEKKIHKVDYDDIAYFSSIGDYVKVFIRDGRMIISSETLKNIEKNLPSTNFVRVHKSYIVSLKAISYIEGNQLLIGQTSIPIGSTYKDQLITRFGTQF